MQHQFMKNKIKLKAGLAVVRVMILYFFYYLDSNGVTPFLANLIGFLLIHEAMVISNYLLMNSYYYTNRILSRSQSPFPSFCVYVDILNNL